MKGQQVTMVAKKHRALAIEILECVQDLESDARRDAIDELVRGLGYGPDALTHEERAIVETLVWALDRS